MISTTRPSPCGSNAHPAASAGPVAATTSMRLHVDTTATHSPQRLGTPVTPSMTPPSVRINCCMLAIRNGLFIRDRRGDEGGPDGSQRHRAYFSDRVEFRTLPQIL